MKKEDKLLECGITVTLFGKGDAGEVSVIDLYEGFGTLSNFKKIAALFTELDSLGYKPTGMSRKMGYYDSMDDLILDFRKK